ncbi:MAG: glycoside hydrolase family 13 [Ferruginibacter sp.]
MTTKITFTLPAANIIGTAECVLLGEFNNWNADKGIYLQKQPDGSMTAEVELIAGNDYQYRYLLSNGRWVNDNGEKITSEMHGYPVVNCIVRVPAITETAMPAAIKKAKSEVRTKPKTVKAKATPAVKAAPSIIKDDLTRVEGIGKKIEALLYKNKIHSYRQLSKATITSLKAILESGGNTFSMHNPGTWPRQAKLAAEAKWEELELLQKHLKGGK